MPVVFRTVIRPTPSIGKPQQALDISKMESTELKIQGRHDPCIAVRAVPVLDAAAALVFMDLLL
jgi:chorismate synthase